MFGTMRRLVENICERIMLRRIRLVVAHNWCCHRCERPYVTLLGRYRRQVRCVRCGYTRFKVLTYMGDTTMNTNCIRCGRGYSITFGDREIHDVFHDMAYAMENYR